MTDARDSTNDPTRADVAASQRARPGWNWVAIGVLATLLVSLLSAGLTVRNDAKQNDLQESLNQATQAFNQRTAGASTPRLDVYKFIGLVTPPAMLSMQFVVQNDGNMGGYGCALVENESPALAGVASSSNGQVLFVNSDGEDPSDFSLDVHKTIKFTGTYDVDPSLLPTARAMTITLTAQCKTPNSTVTPEIITVPIQAGQFGSPSFRLGPIGFATTA